MSKSPQKELAELHGKLDTAIATIKRMEGDAAKLQRRLHAKSQEVAEAKQGRKEALSLLIQAASHDKAIAEKAIALLAADAMTEEQVAAQAAFAASQIGVPGADAPAEG